MQKILLCYIHFLIKFLKFLFFCIFLDSQVLFIKKMSIKQKSSVGVALLGWGHKPTADKARCYALKHNLPYIALEDGFLRSLDLGCKGAQPLSLVVDHTGIYYDATEPSDLENLLNGSGGDSEGQLQSAQHAIEAIKRHDLSKYTHEPRAAEGLLGDAS